MSVLHRERMCRLLGCKVTGHSSALRGRSDEHDGISVSGQVSEVRGEDKCGDRVSDGRRLLPAPAEGARDEEKYHTAETWRVIQGHFIAGLEPGTDCRSTLWHVADDLRLLPRCGTGVSVAAKVPVIDLERFSSGFRLCFTCAPEESVPVSIGDSAIVQDELALGVDADRRGRMMDPLVQLWANLKAVVRAGQPRPARPGETVVTGLMR